VIKKQAAKQIIKHNNFRINALTGALTVKRVKQVVAIKKINNSTLLLN